MATSGLPAVPAAHWPLAEALIYRGLLMNCFHEELTDRL